ncbi:ribonuclease D [Aliiglaciecola sp. LCG003]|uniref:ribonuclease D n=1 Tax=Aliiglaciecola sp. LCG003 TaxID=3053655 RepID=UPI00257467A5|nr:ribonuclease D [Aliiglaciecola sp. LCG003]WJG08205.1 ribonuclease D [Aliiglaciecola sp. LCG003]
MHYTLITTDQKLHEFCAQAQQSDAIAVDTEFVRTRTLYPRLGLIQIFDGVTLALIDPLDITDFGPLVALLSDEKVVKVLHSCSEDLETFWHSLGVVPKPVFDTQFAACLLNMGATLGYANLIEEMLAIKLDKGESRTDWMARPLSEEQCQYAANDVLYLFDVYPSLKQQIEALGRTQWVYQEMEQLARKKTLQVPTELAYLGIKNNWKLTGRELYLLRLLAKWRVEQARKRDLALNFVVRESNLVEIARQQPTNKNALFSIDGLTPQEARIHGDAILEMVNDAKNSPVEVFPAPIERLMEHSGFKKVSAELRAACQQTADALSIPVEVMGSKKQIQQLLKFHWLKLDEMREMGIQPDLISGWRAPLLAAQLDAILSHYQGS